MVVKLMMKLVVFSSVAIIRSNVMESSKFTIWALGHIMENENNTSGCTYKKIYT